MSRPRHAFLRRGVRLEQCAQESVLLGHTRTVLRLGVRSSGPRSNCAASASSVFSGSSFKTRVSYAEAEVLVCSRRSRGSSHGSISPINFEFLLQKCFGFLVGGGVVGLWKVAACLCKHVRRATAPGSKVSRYPLQDHVVVPHEGLQVL